MDSPHLPTPSGASKRLRRKQARPGELLEAALELFVEKGFAATRVEEVAARAGVSKGTLFLYFPSKEELFKAVVRDSIGQHVADGETIMANFQGASGDLLRYAMRTWWTHYGATRAAGICKLMFSEATNFPELAAFYLEEVVRPGRALLARMIQRGIERGEFRPVDVDSTVHIVLAPLLQLALWRYSLGVCCTVDEMPDPLKLIDQHADLLFAGLCLRKSAP